MIGDVAHEEAVNLLCSLFIPTRDVDLPVNDVVEVVEHFIPEK
jgi:hypothetical protein